MRHFTTDKIIMPIPRLLGLIICFVAFGSGNICAQEIRYLPVIEELQTNNSSQFPKYFVSQANYAPQQAKATNKSSHTNMLAFKSISQIPAGSIKILFSVPKSMTFCFWSIVQIICFKDCPFFAILTAVRFYPSF